MQLSLQRRLLVLLAVEALGGEGSKKAALDFIARQGLVELDSRDREELPTRSELRWRNELAYARGELVTEGHLSGARHNVWALTAAGSVELDRLCGEAQAHLIRGRSLEWLSVRATEFLQARADRDAPTADRQDFTIRVVRLLKQNLSRPAGQASPQRVDGSVTGSYRRDPRVAAWVLREARGVCELCGSPAPFDSNDGPFLEIHHVVKLADGGPDVCENTVAVCPNCHRELHHGRRSTERVNRLYERLSRLHRPPLRAARTPADRSRNE